MPVSAIDELDDVATLATNELMALDDRPDRRDIVDAGDDYELCFTARPEAVAGIDGITAIGKIVEGHELVCRRDGDVVEFDDRGYRHFA